MQPVLRRRDDAGLVLAVERVGVAAAPAAPGGLGRSPARATAAVPTAAPGGADPASAEQAPPADRRGSSAGRLRFGHRDGSSALASRTQATAAVELGQRLGQRVDRVGQLLDLGLRSARRRARSRRPRACSSSSVCSAANRASSSSASSGSLLPPAPAARPSKPTRAPSTLAWKSQRSVCDQSSSSPVTLPVATSSSRPWRRWRSGRR